MKDGMVRIYNSILGYFGLNPPRALSLCAPVRAYFVLPMDHLWLPAIILWPAAIICGSQRSFCGL